MSKPDPAQTGQQDAQATGQIYQNLISQQEQFNNQQQQAQRGAAAGLAMPYSGADQSGGSRAPESAGMAAKPAQEGSAAPAAAQAVDPTAQAAPGQQTAPVASAPTQQAPAATSAPVQDPTAAQGAPTQGAGPSHPDHQAMTTIQHIVNALDPGAKMRSQQAAGPRQPVMSPLPGQQQPPQQ